MEAIGGSVNGEGAITIEIRKTSEQTYLAQVIDMVRRAQESRSRTQDLANRAAFERARKLQAVVFDKTGTLTEGHFGVSDIVLLDDLDDNASLRVAAAWGILLSPAAGAVLMSASTVIVAINAQLLSRRPAVAT